MSGSMEETRQGIVEALNSERKDERLGALGALQHYGEVGAQLELGDEVVKLLNDKVQEVQIHAILALGKLGEMGAKYAPDLLRKLDTKDPQIVVAACDALSELGPSCVKYSSELMPVLKHENSEARSAAMCVLGTWGAKKHMQDIADLLNDKSTTCVLHATKALCGFNEDAAGYAKEVVKNSCDHKHPEVRKAAVDFLVSAGVQVCVTHKEKLCKAVADEDPKVRYSAIMGFELHGAELAGLVKDLAALLTSKDGRARAAAAMCLCYVGEPAGDHAAAIAALIDDSFEDRSHESVSVGGVMGRPMSFMRLPRVAAVLTLRKIGPEGVKHISKVAELLEDENYEAKSGALTSLGSMGKAATKFEPQIVELCSSRNILVAACAIEALGKISEAKGNTDSRHVNLIVKKIKHQHPSIRAGAVMCLGRMGSKAGLHVELLMKCLKDRANKVVTAAMWSLAQVGPRGTVYAPEVARLMDHPDWTIRAEAIEALGHYGERGAAFAEEIAGHMDELIPSVRISALKALAEMGEDARPYIELIKEMQKDPLQRVRDAADEAVNKLEGK